MKRLLNFTKATAFVAYATLVLDREVNFQDPESQVVQVNQYQ